MIAMGDRSSTEASTEFSTFTRAAVALHCTPTDCWVIIRGNVYDVSSFLCTRVATAGVQGLAV